MPRRNKRKREKELRLAMNEFPAQTHKKSTKKSEAKPNNGGTNKNKKNLHKKKKAAPKELTAAQPQQIVKQPKLTKQIECTFSYSGKGYGFATPIDAAPGSEDIFIPPMDTLGAMTGDRILVAVHDKAPDSLHRTEGEVTAILTAACTALVGILHVAAAGYAYVTPSISRMNTPVYIARKDLETLDVHDNIKVEVIPDGGPAFNRGKSFTPERVPTRRRANDRRKRREEADVLPTFELRGHISKVFGDAASKEANYAAVLYETGIRTEFPDEVLRDAESSSKEKLKRVGRRDLRKRRIFTIDGAGAKDLDDAISIEETKTGYILGVHIADVSHYVPYGSSVEEEAALRGTSVYFTDKVVPMLPQSLSNGSCSLNAGEDKYALSTEITLDKKGRRKGTKIFKSLIRSTVRGVYSEVNDVLELGETSEFYEKYRAVYDDLCVMHRLYEILRANGQDRGALELEDSEAVILLDEAGHPVDVVRRERGDAERLIEQFMLQANMGVAETMLHHRLPCLYRVHEEPDPVKIQDFAVFAHNLGLHTGDLAVYTSDGNSDEPAKDAKAKGKKASKKTEVDPPAKDSTGLSERAKKLSETLMRILDEADERGIADIVSSVLLRCMMKARYAPECSGHFGLGADRYCHFTSPIRRYPDYFVHSVITAALEGAEDRVLKYKAGEAKKTGEALEESEARERAVAVFRRMARERAESANDGEIRAQTAERAIENIYMALYMSDKIGQQFEGTVCSVMRFGIFVRLPNLIEGMIPAQSFRHTDVSINEEMRTFSLDGKTYTLGSAISVIVEESDVSTGKITFSMAMGERWNALS